MIIAQHAGRKTVKPRNRKKNVRMSRVAVHLKVQIQRAHCQRYAAQVSLLLHRANRDLWYYAALSCKRAQVVLICIPYNIHIPRLLPDRCALFFLVLVCRDTFPTQAVKHSLCNGSVSVSAPKERQTLITARCQCWGLTSQAGLEFRTKSRCPRRPCRVVWLIRCYQGLYFSSKQVW